MRHRLIGILLAALAASWLVGDAFAHAVERGFILLLPTGYYRAGGAAAVLLSFVLLAFLPARELSALAARAWRIARVRPVGRTIVSCLSFLATAALVVAGWYGSRDPLSNPLPLMFWSVLWVGFTMIQGVFGNLWSWLNPWIGPYVLARAVAGGNIGRSRRGLAALGHWPAFLGFGAFAWLELVYPAPGDPAWLATLLALYWVATFAAMLVFGPAWLRRGEFLTVFFWMVSRLAVVGGGRTGAREVVLRLPAARLAESVPLPTSGILFLLLALSSVSFDGLMHTFFWLGTNGINPLEFPGRSAVVGLNSFGLVLTFGLLAAAFLASVALGNRLAGESGAPLAGAGALVWSIMPIALAYQFSHYLVSLLVNGQYALAALSDPLSTGWNLFGTAGLHVTAAIAAGAHAVWVLWNVQAAAIIAGHVLAVIVAHIIAYRRFGDSRRALLSQIPLAILMVGYTVFGLWLLSTPTA